MKKILPLIALTCAAFQLCAKEQKVGVVNFNSCIADSKLGKQEQNAFETMRKQFISLVEDTDKQLREVSEKLQDKDHLDGLSDEGVEALHAKAGQLQEELNRYQQQYYQFMEQGRYKIIQTVVGGISGAAEEIASSKGFTVLLNKEACFYVAPEHIAPDLDVTADIIKGMDKQFDEESKAAEKKE